MVHHLIKADTKGPDFIVSGDLSQLGKELLVNICYANGITLLNNYEVFTSN